MFQMKQIHMFCNDHRIASVKRCFPDNLSGYMDSKIIIVVPEVDQPKRVNYIYSDTYLHFYFLFLTHTSCKIFAYIYLGIWPVLYIPHNILNISIFISLCCPLWSFLLSKAKAFTYWLLGPTSEFILWQGKLKNFGCLEISKICMGLKVISSSRYIDTKFR